MADPVIATKVSDQNFPGYPQCDKGFRSTVAIPRELEIMNDDRATDDIGDQTRAIGPGGAWTVDVRPGPRGERVHA